MRNSDTNIKGESLSFGAGNAQSIWNNKLSFHRYQLQDKATTKDSQRGTGSSCGVSQGDNRMKLLELEMQV